MIKFLVYVVFSIVLFFLIKTAKTSIREERRREIEREEEERKRYERERIEFEKKRIRREKEMFGLKKDKA